MPVHPPAKASTRRTLGLVCLAVMLMLTVVVAVRWWSDRSLQEIENQLEVRGDAERALAAADAFLARRPTHPRALVLKARALAELGRWTEASELFSRVGADTPDEIRAWATALVNQQRFSEALPLLERLLEQNPDDVVALRQVITCRFQTGLTDAALESAGRLAEIEGHEVEGIVLAGVIHRSRHDITRALACWERVERLRPNAEGTPVPPAEFFLIYGEDLLAAGLPATAARKLQRSREMQAGLAVELRLAQCWAAIDKAAEAEAVWKRALAHDAGNEEAHQGLAEIALAQGDGHEALKWLTAIAWRPDVSSYTTYLMERAHTLLGHDEELEHWQRRTAELRESERQRAAFKRKLQSGK